MRGSSLRSIVLLTVSIFLATLIVSLISNEQPKISATSLRQQTGACPRVQFPLAGSEQGRVTPGSPNNVRRSASSRAERLGSIPSGGSY